MSRSLALTRARYARIVFAATAAGSAAVALLVVPTFTKRPVMDDDPPAAPTASVLTSAASENTTGNTVNSGGISDRFMQFSNRPKIDPPVESPVEMGDDDDPPPPPPAENARFLGVIREPGRLLAMIAVGGRQRIMAEGEEVSGLKIVSIGPESVTVREGGVEKTIQRNQRSGASTSTVAKGPSTMSPVQPGSMPEAQGLDARANASSLFLQQQRGRGRPNLPTIPAIGGNRNREQRSSPGQ